MKCDACEATELQIQKSRLPATFETLESGQRIMLCYNCAHPDFGDEEPEYMQQGYRGAKAGTPGATPKHHVDSATKRQLADLESIRQAWLNS